MYVSLLRLLDLSFVLAAFVSLAWWLAGFRRARKPSGNWYLGRQLLLKGLGILWILAALLQAQPDMFTPDFYAFYPQGVMPSLLQQAAQDRPLALAAFMHFSSQIWGLHPLLFNVLVMVLQGSIGLTLLFGKSGLLRVGLKLSLVWGLFVWILGEGMGGVFESGGSFFTGWPGSALLYSLGAVLLLLPEVLWQSGRVGQVVQRTLAIWWIAMAVLQALPQSGFWTSSGLLAIFGNSATVQQPWVLAAPVQAFALLVVNHAALLNLLFVLLLLSLGLLHLLPAWPKWTLDISLIWLLWSWWFGQDFGTLFAGLGTDVNTAPALILLTLAGWLAKKQRASAVSAQGVLSTDS